MQVEKTYTAAATPAPAVNTTTTMVQTVQPATQATPCGCKDAKAEGDKLVKRVNIGITLFHIVLVLAIILFLRKIFS